MTIKREFGHRLRRACEDKWPGKSQRFKAGKLGVSQPTLSEYLSGLKMPSTDTGVSLALTLGVSFEWLMTGRQPGHAFDPALADDVVRALDDYLHAQDMAIRPSARAVVIMSAYLLAEPTKIVTDEIIRSAIAKAQEG